MNIAFILGYAAICLNQAPDGAGGGDYHCDEIAIVCEVDAGALFPTLHCFERERPQRPASPEDGDG